MAVRQLLGVAAAVVALVALSGSSLVRDSISPDDALIVLALASMAVGVMSALSAALLGWLIDDERAVWIGAAFGLYSLVAVPTSAIGLGSAATLWGIDDARFAAQTYLVAVLFVAALRPEWRQRCGGRTTVALGLLWVGLVVVLGALFPAETEPVVSSLYVWIVLATGGTLAGLLCAVVGWLTRTPAYSWTGLGCMVIASAHIEKLSPSITAISPGVSFAAVRLFGMSLVTVGLSALAARMLHAVAQANSSQEEELRLARVQLVKVAEQGHEIRNGLAGLAGATSLLIDRTGEREVLQAAVTSELARLNALLRSPPEAADARSEPDHHFEVNPVLVEQVALRRSAGVDIRMDAEPHLHAVGSRSMLAQVLTNLLANCAAHAPDSPIRIEAGRRADTVFVRVTDFGPGVPEGSERAVLGAGVRGAQSSGQGLGLHICEQLVRAVDGSIEVHPRRGVASGCTVTLRPPAAEPDGSSAAHRVGSFPNGAASPH